MKQVKSAFFLLFQLCIMCFFWEVAMDSNRELKGNTCVAALTFPDHLPWNVAGELANQDSQSWDSLAAVACWRFVWVFQFHHVFSNAWQGRESGKNGHRNISRSSFYWCKWDIKFRQLQKVYHIGNRISDALCYILCGNRIFTFKLVSYYQPVKISIQSLWNSIAGGNCLNWKKIKKPNCLFIIYQPLSAVNLIFLPSLIIFLLSVP